MQETEKSSITDEKDMILSDLENGLHDAEIKEKILMSDDPRITSLISIVGGYEEVENLLNIVKLSIRDGLSSIDDDNYYDREHPYDTSAIREHRVDFDKFTFEKYLEIIAIDRGAL